MKAFAVVVAMMVAATTFAGPDVQTTELDQLRTAAKCSDKASVWRVWCIPTEWDKGTAGALPKGKILVGLTIELEAKKDIRDALSNSVSLSALAIDADGKVKLTQIKPTDKDEQTAVAESVANLAVLFKGKANSAKIPDALAQYVRTLKGTYEAKKDGTAWTWKGANPSKLRKIGGFWVVLETVGDDGLFATVLAEQWN